jgi:hypothetical protein
MASSARPFEVLLLLGIFIVLLLIWRTKHASAAAGTIDAVNPNTKAPVKVAIAALMRKPIDLMLWLEHHRKEAGVYRFYIRLEDSPGVAAFLRTQPDVWFVEAESDRENNYTTLQKRQIEFVNMVLPMARADGVDWVFHTDVDELIEGNSVKVLGALPDTVLVGKLENAEAVYGEEEPTCFSAKKFIRCSAGGPCTAYANGKGCGRTADGVQLIGPHDFGYKGKIDDAVTQRIPFDNLHVLHYDSCTIGSWLEKFQHLSKSAKLDEIVFPYYKKSIEAAQGAVAVYKEHKMDTGDRKMDPAWTYTRSA